MLSVALTAGAVVFCAVHSRSRPTPGGEDSVQYREKNDANRVQGDNTEIWESISRHLLGNTQ